MGHSDAKGSHRERSLARFLVRRVALLALPLVTITLALQWYWERELVLGVFDDGLRERAASLATLVTSHEGYVEFDFADEYMTQYSREVDPYYFQIWLADGTPIERSVSLGELELPARAGRVEEPARFDATLADGRRVRAVGVHFPVRAGPAASPDRVEEVRVVVAVGAEELAARLRVGAVQVLITGVLTGAGVLIAVLVALGLGRRVLARVTDEVRRIDPRHLDRRPDVAEAPSEVRPLLEALDGCLEVIAESLERERRFAADVAHELRTPLAELRASAEVAATWPERHPPADALRECHAVALEMERVLESLLELAHAQASPVAADSGTVDLVELARAHAGRRAELGAGARVRLHVEGPAMVRGTEALWSLVLRNLLDNALDHSPGGSPVDVHVRSNGVVASVRVDNQAIDLAPQDVACFTTDPRRVRGSRGGRHAGLGLAITVAASKRLGAWLRFELEAGVLRAHVSVPR